MFAYGAGATGLAGEFLLHAGSRAGEPASDAGRDLAVRGGTAALKHVTEDSAHGLRPAAKPAAVGIGATTLPEGDVAEIPQRAFSAKGRAASVDSKVCLQKVSSWLCAAAVASV